MRYRAVFWILLSLAFLMALSTRPASAGLDSWHFGSTFHVGGVHFRVGFAEVGPYGSSFYFEAAQPFRYHGYGCSSYCYRQGARYYHHPTCSAVHHHFSRHGYAPAYFIEHFGPPVRVVPRGYYYSPPRWNTHYYGHYDRHYYGDRHHRYKHHPHKVDRGRRDRNWDSRFRHDRGRHDRSRHDRDRHNRGGIDRD